MIGSCPCFNYLVFYIFMLIFEYYLSLNIKKMEITKLEKEVLEIISWGDEYEDTPAECFDEIFSSFKGTKNQLKGVIGSLEKKELIWLGEFPNGLTSYHLDNKLS